MSLNQVDAQKSPTIARGKGVAFNRLTTALKELNSQDKHSSKPPQDRQSRRRMQTLPPKQHEKQKSPEKKVAKQKNFIIKTGANGKDRNPDNSRNLLIQTSLGHARTMQLQSQTNPTARLESIPRPLPSAAPTLLQAGKPNVSHSAVLDSLREFPSSASKQTLPQPSIVIQARKAFIQSFSTQKVKRSSSPDRITAPSYIVYYYSIAYGNNSEMIERVLSNRTWWKRLPNPIPGKPAAQPAQSVQFYWKMMMDSHTIAMISEPNAGTGGYLGKRSINRFTHSYELGDKDNFFRNMWFMCKRQNLDVFDAVPLTFSFRMNEFQFEKDLQNFCKLFIANERKCSLDAVKPIREFHDEKLKENVEVFHEFGFDFINRNWASRKFTNVDSHQITKLPQFFHQRNLWILKPSGCDRGKGVEIFKSLDELSKFLYLYTSGYNMSEYMNMNYNDSDNTSPALKEGAMTNKCYKTIFPKFVIQKYMEKPALFKGFKFDIRAHALYTQDKGLYVFRDSYVRICSLPYNLDKNNYFAHLCNTSVNMKSGSFGQIAVGNTISVVELAEFFDRQEAGNPKNTIKNFELYFFEEIKRLVKFAFDAMHVKDNLMNPMDVQNTFELFGFDVMVDESYRCWLIEANFIPGLTDESNDYLKEYLDRMTDDMFKLTLDEIYPLPRNCRKTVQNYNFMKFPPEENLWKFICRYE